MAVRLQGSPHAPDQEVDQEDDDQERVLDGRQQHLPRAKAHEPTLSRSGLTTMDVFVRMRETAGLAFDSANTCYGSAEVRFQVPWRTWILVQHPRSERSILLVVCANVLKGDLTQDDSTIAGARDGHRLSSERT